MIQIINITKPGRTHRWFSTAAEDERFWMSALVAIKFTRLDLMGGDIGVDGKIIDASLNRVIGAFNMNISRGAMYDLMSGLAWTFDAVVAGAAIGLNTVGNGLGAVGDGLGAVGEGIGTGIEVVGDGIGAAGGAVGRGVGTVVGGAANLVGDMAYNMAKKTFIESGYIQAATTIAIVLVLIDLRKNKII